MHPSSIRIRSGIKIAVVLGVTYVDVSTLYSPAEITRHIHGNVLT